MADTIPNKTGPGGQWIVVCSCGWERRGLYRRSNEIAEAVALNLANLFGERHEKGIEEDAHE